MAIPRTLAFDRPLQATPAETFEVSFIPEGLTSFSYDTSQYINIPLKCTKPNAFLDPSHSFLRMTIENPSDEDIYFDCGSHSIVKTLKILQGNAQTIEQIDYYNRLYDLFTEHYASSSWQTEQQLITGYSADVNSSDALLPTATNEANNMIPRGQKRTYCISLMSGFLNAQKLIPLCMIPGFLSINITLEDPRNAFIIKKTEKSASQIRYVCSNIEYVSSIVSFKDNNLIDNLKRRLLNEGLYIASNTWDCQTHILNKDDTDVNFNISQRHQSLKYMLSAFYRNTPNSQFSNLQSQVGCSYEHSCSIGGQKYPQNGIKYDNKTKNFIHPYLELQKIVSSGFWSIKNTTCVNLKKFSRQFCNTIIDDKDVRTEIKTSGTVTTAGIKNDMYQGSFVQGISFENFPNTASVESGLNTSLLSVNPVWNFKRSLAQLQGEGEAGTTAEFPTMLHVVWLGCDVIYRLGGDGQFTVMK